MYKNIIHIQLAKITVFIVHVGYDGGMRGGEDGSMVHQLQRAMDLEETDKDTLHLLVFLLMQFLSQPQHVSLYP